MTSGLMRCFRWKTGWFNNETSVEILDFDVVLLPVDLQTTRSSVRCSYVKLSGCIKLTMADVYLWLSVKCQRSTRLSDFSVAAMHWALHLHLQHVTRVHVGKKRISFPTFHSPKNNYLHFNWKTCCHASSVKKFSVFWTFSKPLSAAESLAYHVAVPHI